ncbi:MAG: flavodoxin domain-containing protein [Betaproteobacteria bacterium]|nr:flavodoxin domain-containing protein [Betaproteobacteria bacterium]
MSLRITILVGTMTGTAQLCAQEMELALGGDDVEVETLLMDRLDGSVFEREGVFLVCTSTYGQGDVPDNAKGFYEHLQSARPDLSRVRYGVFGLGDRTYAETFNFGGKRFDELLSGLGAQRIGERHMHDASSGILPEETALEWCEHWLALVRERMKQAA